MKKWLPIIFCLCTYYCQAQTESIPFQSILTDNQETVLINVSAELQIDIIENSQNGAIVYSEIHNIVSGDNGELYINIGTGIAQSNEFDQVDWTKPNYVELSIKPDGFGNFFSTGKRQLLSVPYALFALKVTCEDGCPGEAGEKGRDCWDDNENGVEDIDEDINGDGLYNADDCAGLMGSTGNSGAPGLPGINGTNGIDGLAGVQALRMVDSLPTSPSDNEIYLDDGTNRADGLPGFMFFNGTNWIEF